MTSPAVQPYLVVLKHSNCIKLFLTGKAMSPLIPLRFIISLLSKAVMLFTIDWYC